MKRKLSLVLPLLSLLLLSSCSIIDTITGKTARENQELYDGLYNQLATATTFDSSVNDYDLTLNVETTGDTYRFTLTIDNPRVAMRNVELMVMDSTAINNADQGLVLTQGIVDQTINLYPNQVYEALNAYDKVEVEGSITRLPETLRIMVSYMDEAGAITTKQFFLFEIDDYGSQTLSAQ